MSFLSPKNQYYIQLFALFMTGLLLLIGEVPGLGLTLNQSIFGSITLGTILGGILLWMGYGKWKHRS